MIKDYRLEILKIEVCGKMHVFETLSLDGRIENILPGQFVNLILPEKIARAYSVASMKNIDGKTIIQLALEYIPGGKASEYLKSKTEGDILIVKAPFGRFVPSICNFVSKDFKSEKFGREHILIGTGSGITPIICLAQGFRDSNVQGGYFKFSEIQTIKSLKIFYGSRYSADCVLVSEIDNIVQDLKQVGIEALYDIFITDKNDSSNHNKGRVYLGLDKLQINDDQDFYISGSKEIVLSIKDYLLSRNVKESQIFTERFN